MRVRLRQVEGGSYAIEPSRTITGIDGKPTHDPKEVERLRKELPRIRAMANKVLGATVILDRNSVFTLVVPNTQAPDFSLFRGWLALCLEEPMNRSKAA